MPIAQFQDPRNNLNIVRNFRTPKYLLKPEAWVRAVRQSIKEVPDIRNGWYIEQFEPTLTTITITLRNSTGERCYVAVNRKTEF